MYCSHYFYILSVLYEKFVHQVVLQLSNILLTLEILDSRFSLHDPGFSTISAASPSRVLQSKPSTSSPQQTSTPTSTNPSSHSNPSPYNSSRLPSGDQMYIMYSRHCVLASFIFYQGIFWFFFFHYLFFFFFF